jgi:hypothetical protein
MGYVTSMRPLVVLVLVFLMSAGKCSYSCTVRNAPPVPVEESNTEFEVGEPTVSTDSPDGGVH